MKHFKLVVSERRQNAFEKKFSKAFLRYFLFSVGDIGGGVFLQHPMMYADSIGCCKNSEKTVTVIEHDKDVIKIADHIVDVGPNAGTNISIKTISICLSSNFFDIIACSSLTFFSYIKGENGLMSSDFRGLKIREFPLLLYSKRMGWGAIPSGGKGRSKSTGMPVSSTPSCGKRSPHPGSEVEAPYRGNYSKKPSTVSLLRDLVDRLKLIV
ncbi:hypothetical protein ACERJO_20710 [Halalkalibacter sp. AB-rgal2]|uniref:hypothetical protein n=1 Tax=Halalkalibacter sp. AB-rgal2 TaxID=3242695 RepID=UPI00359E0ED2